MAETTPEYSRAYTPTTTV